MQFTFSIIWNNNFRFFWGRIPSKVEEQKPAKGFSSQNQKYRKSRWYNDLFLVNSKILDFFSFNFDKKKEFSDFFGATLVTKKWKKISNRDRKIIINKNFTEFSFFKQTYFLNQHVYISFDHPVYKYWKENSFIKSLDLKVWSQESSDKSKNLAYKTFSTNFPFRTARNLQEEQRKRLANYNVLAIAS